MPVPHAPRGSSGRTRDRMALLSRTAYDLVAEVGHPQLTLAEVARRAGLSDAQVLYLFPSRDHLLVGALDHADARTLAAFDEARVAEAADPAAALAGVVARWSSDGHLVRLHVSATAAASDPGHPAHAWAGRHRAAAASRCAALLRALQARGWAAPDVSPDGFARQLVALADGLRAASLVDHALDLATEVGAGLRTLARHDATRAAEGAAAASAAAASRSATAASASTVPAPRA